MNLWPDNDTTNASAIDLLKNQLTEFNKKNNRACAIMNSDGETLEFGIFPFNSELNAVSLLKITGYDKYPCKLWFDGKPSRCRTRAELIGKLAWVFNHDKTINAINDLTSGL